MVAMADVYNRVFLHLIWATYDRLPKLTPEVRALAYWKITAEAEALRCPVHAIGGREKSLSMALEYCREPTSTSQSPEGDFSSLAANLFDGENHAI